MYNYIRPCRSRCTITLDHAGADVLYTVITEDTSKAGGDRH
jgi:hypothetical protein